MPAPDGRMSCSSPLRTRDLLDHDAGVGVVDVDHHFLDRLQALAGDRIVSGRARAGGRRRARSPRGAWSRSARPAAARRGRRPRRNRRSRCRRTRMATLPSPSRIRRARIMRVVTLSPSVPASGESLTEKVMASVGGSTGWPASGPLDGLVADRVGHGRGLEARRRRRCRRPRRCSSATRSSPRKASTLVMRVCSISLPSRLSDFTDACWA